MDGADTDQPIGSNDLYTYRGIGNLPAQLLSRILQVLLPPFQVDAIPKGIRAFRHKIDPFAELRLVSSGWCQIATPLLFRGAVLVVNPATHIDFIARFFDLRSPHIQAIMVYGDYEESHLSYRVVANAVGMGIGRCKKLNSLSCQGSHPTFFSPSWMTDFAPNLASTVTSLSFSVVDGNMVPLSRALMELGPSIQSLDIRFWEDNTQKFEIPLSFPNVHHLELRNFNDQVPVKELINRITANPSTNTLQSLHIPHVNHQYWQLVSDILSINNLGAKLTSIHLYFGQFHQSEALVTKIMDLCRDLVDLTYTSPFPK
ncbi:hypothetical protein H0H87_012300, partial [Tephrocybe sp. NHM501043]